jgi:hypothetical protein
LKSYEQITSVGKIERSIACDLSAPQCPPHLPEQTLEERRREIQSEFRHLRGESNPSFAFPCRYYLITRHVCAVTSKNSRIIQLVISCPVPAIGLNVYSWNSASHSFLKYGVVKENSRFAPQILFMLSAGYIRTTVRCV